jgi:hypothetical protein
MEMLAIEAERAVRRKSALLEQQERRRDKDAISAATATSAATVSAAAVMASARDTASLSPRASGKYSGEPISSAMIVCVPSVVQWCHSCNNTACALCVSALCSCFVMHALSSKTVISSYLSLCRCHIYADTSDRDALHSFCTLSYCMYIQYSLNDTTWSTSKWQHIYTNET